MTNNVSLCFRCEHRALWHESNGEWKPRCECGDYKISKFTCYMYRPVKPVVLEKLDKKDRRSVFSPALFSARSCIAKKQKDIFELNAHKGRGWHVFFWKVK